MLAINLPSLCVYPGYFSIESNVFAKFKSMLFLNLAAIGTCNLGSISLDQRRQFLQPISDLKKIVIIDFLLFFLSKSKAECPVFVAWFTTNISQWR
jgi:hypothetical protein